MPSTPIVIGFDGSPASQKAVREAAALLPSHPALVVVVWEEGAAYEMGLTSDVTGYAPAPVDIRTSEEIDEAMYEGAKRTAHQGAAMAREAGFEAEGLAVADELTVAETLVRVAEEREAGAIVIGMPGRSRLGDRLLGSASHGVLHRAHCPVVVVRDEG
jgi:nucleotide-binding universal stress UspA family protein